MQRGETQRGITKWMLLVGAVISVAGILFGYDQGVISGALLGIGKDFHVGTTATEIITSWVTLGALVGALVAGVMADKIGRRPTLLFAGSLFSIGALIEALAPGTEVLVVGRLVVGFAVGVASVAAPLYAAEMAPSRLRGMFVSGYQLGITFGIFLAYLVDELMSASDWRLMLGVSAVVGVALVILVLPLPDSPRWYLKVGRRNDARDAIAKVAGDPDPDATIAELEADVAGETQASWGVAFSKRWRTPLIVGVGLAVFQQITGINAIIYYADKIFDAAGFSTVASQTAATTWAIGAVNVLATLIAVFFVDRLGRKPLLIAGLIGMTISLTAVGFAFQELGDISHAPSSQGPSDAGAITLVALVVYIASFAMSMGPIVWTIINEIYPREVRGRMVSIATAVNWFSAWLVSQFFLTLVKQLGESETFWLFAALCVAALAFVWRKVPETKDRTLEEIEQMWNAPKA
ncbi:MAG: sugar porter family MFS transporter [Thermoleophilaceae bacterium]|nr:sugar porter family MFS transporter [Thermoleophilaceae bacterium]